MTRSIVRRLALALGALIALSSTPAIAAPPARQVPVLLVHGANQDADLAWADPNEAGALVAAARPALRPD